MTRDQNIEAIRAACKRANPEIQDWCKGHDRKTDGCFSCAMSANPIRLADVLFTLAWHGHEYGANGAHNVNEFVVSVLKHGRFDWSLHKDDLTEQSDECVAFLYDLLK